MNKFILTAAKQWKILLLFNLLLLASTVYILLFAERTWTAKAKLILPKPTSALNADLGTLGTIEGGDGAVFSQQLNSLKILASIITSKDVVRDVWQQDQEKDLYPRLEQYRNLFSVSPENESTIIDISVDGSSPEVAKERSKMLLVTFQKRLQQLRTAGALEQSSFFSEEIAVSRSNLEKAEAALNDYKSSANLVDNDIQAQEILSGIKALNTEKSQAIAQGKANQARARELSARLNMTPEAGLRSLRLGENPEYLALQQSLSNIESRLAIARAQFFEDSPQIQNLLGEKAKLTSKLAGYGDQDLSSQPGFNGSSSQNSSGLIQEMILADSAAKESQQQVKQLGLEVEQMNQELQQLPGKQKKLIELRRRFNTAEGVHNGLMAQAQGSKLNGLSSYPNAQILDEPDVDLKPTKPKKSLVLLGYLLASSLGSVAIILLFDQGQTLLDIRDIEEIDLPILANIPVLKNPQQDIRLDESVVIELQRLALAVSMMELKKDRLMVTSTTGKEGKTTVVLGLAYALADLGFRVLMVDGDHRHANLSHSLGYFEQQESALVTVQPAAIAERIDLLPAISQPKNIAEFFARGAFEQELNIIQQEKSYDYVLVDSPPISLTSEAAMMSRIIQNILYVVRPGLTDSEQFFHSVKQVDTHDGNIAGLIINGVNNKKPYLTYKSKVYLPESV